LILYLILQSMKSIWNNNQLKRNYHGQIISNIKPLHVHLIDRKSSWIGIEFDTKFEPEHGIGIKISGSTITVGAGEDAFE
jgi:hypothetical protein